MSNFLLRGIPPNIHRRAERMARVENLSMNQVLVRLLIEAMQVREEKENQAKRRKVVFRRIDELREKIHKKYGRQDDSVKIIREMREERLRRLAGDE